MARRCDLLASKGKLKGHRVSHSNIKTNYQFKPNLKQVTLHSETLRRDIRLKISVKTERCITKSGSLDAFLISRPGNPPGNGRSASKKLTELGLTLRRKIKKMMLAQTETSPSEAASEVVA